MRHCAGCRLGARLKRLALEKPDAFRQFDNQEQSKIIG